MLTSDKLIWQFYNSAQFKEKVLNFNIHISWDYTNIHNIRQVYISQNILHFDTKRCRKEKLLVWKNWRAKNYLLVIIRREFSFMITLNTRSSSSAIHQNAPSYELSPTRKIIVKYNKYSNWLKSIWKQMDIKEFWKIMSI